MTLKLKPASESPPAFSWDVLPSSPPASTDNIDSLPSPPTSWLSSQDMKMFGAQPLKSDIGVVECKDCDKPILRSAMLDHAENCLLIRSGAGGEGCKSGTVKIEVITQPLLEGPNKRKPGDEEPEAPSAQIPKKNKPIPKLTNFGPVQRAGGLWKAVRNHRCHGFTLLAVTDLVATSDRARVTKAETKEKGDKDKAEKKRLATRAYWPLPPSK